MHNPKNILVTGGAGFIGSNFILHMLGKYKNIKIFNLDKLTYASNSKNLLSVNTNSNYKFYEGDICDRDLVYKIFLKNNIDTVIHFAAESHVDRSITSASDFIKTNIIGTNELLEAATKFWNISDTNRDNYRFHHISTDEVYGSLDQDDEAFKEDNKYFPNSPYSATKASSDHLVNAWAGTFKLPVTISNCSNNYGKYQHNEKLIPVIINACLNQTPIPIYGNGKNIRDWLHVDDHCNAIDLIIRNAKNNSVFNIGGNSEKSNLEVVEIICELCDFYIPRSLSYKELITFVNDRKGHDFRYAINCNKIKKELNWSPVISFEEGIKDTVKWYLNK